jgi:hypothetical protein
MDNKINFTIHGHTQGNSDTIVRRSSIIFFYTHCMYSNGIRETSLHHASYGIMLHFIMSVKEKCIVLLSYNKELVPACFTIFTSITL